MVASLLQLCAIVLIMVSGDSLIVNLHHWHNGGWQQLGLELLVDKLLADVLIGGGLLVETLCRWLNSGQGQLDCDLLMGLAICGHLLV